MKEQAVLSRGVAVKALEHPDLPAPGSLSHGQKGRKAAVTAGRRHVEKDYVSWGPADAQDLENLAVGVARRKNDRHTSAFLSAFLPIHLTQVPRQQGRNLADWLSLSFLFLNLTLF